MNKQQKINELLAQIEALKLADSQKFSWDDAPLICTLDGTKWLLGQESEEKMQWLEAVKWCKSVGGELPPRSILLLAYINEDTQKLFKPKWYWTSTGLNDKGAWKQYFFNGTQGFGTTQTLYHVRAVKRLTCC